MSFWRVQNEKTRVLIKYNFLRTLGGLQGKKKRKSTISASITLVLLGLGILALYSFQAYSMFKGLAPLGLSQICVFHGVLVAFSVLLILGVMRSASKKKQTDEDMLLSLPIKKYDIVLSKTMGKYILDNLLCFALVMPFVVIYMIYEGFSLTMLLCSLFLVVSLPLFSVGISYICGFIISRIFNKSKHANLIKSLFSVFILMLVMALLLVKTFGYGVISPENAGVYFSDRPITFTLTKFLLGGDAISFIWLLILTITPFVLGIILYSLSLGKSGVGYKSSKKEIVFSNAKSPLKSMVKKEVSFYAESSAFVSNTILSPLLMIVISIMACSLGVEGFSNKLGVSLNNEMFAGILTLIFLFSLSTAIISCSTISLEGKNFWILKSSPIKEKYIFHSKALLQIIMTVPAIILSSILLLIFLKLSLFDFLMTLCVPVLFAVLLSYGGLLINLLFPKMEWEEETQVIKQSVACLITMFGGMVLSLIPLGLFLLLPNFSLHLIGLISGAIYLVLLVMCVSLLFTKGKKLLNKIQ